MLNIVVDTNVIIDLAEKFETLGPNCETNDRFDLSRIFTMIASGQVHLYTVPKVEQEVRRGSKKDGGKAERFMDKFCDHIDLDKEEKTTAKQLAYDYGNIILYDKFPAINNAQNSDSKNFGDALIVAQISIAQSKMQEELCLLTQNTKDVFDFQGINTVNGENGLPRVAIYSKRSFFKMIEKELTK